MAMKVNIRHLEAHDVRLTGEVSPEDLDIENVDEVIEVRDPLAYDVEVQLMENGLLATGSLALPLTCRCVRCLKEHVQTLEIPDWTLHLSFEGEEAVPVNNDVVDLTPYAREDILLEFPQHPLCDPECRGLPGALLGDATKARPEQAKPDSSTWAELNKLKL